MAALLSIDYRNLQTRIEDHITHESDVISNLSNISSEIWHEFVNTRGANSINWVGFYRLISDELVLGPFIGKPACSRFSTSKGVCGAAVLSNSVQRVANVHEFPGHISCDDASNSELVVPIQDASGIVIGVLDLDCPLVCILCVEYLIDVCVSS